jgi:hypothetical protein
MVQLTLETLSLEVERLQYKVKEYFQALNKAEIEKNDLRLKCSSMERDLQLKSKQIEELKSINLNLQQKNEEELKTLMGFEITSKEKLDEMKASVDNNRMRILQLLHEVTYELQHSLSHFAYLRMTKRPLVIVNWKDYLMASLMNLGHHKSRISANVRLLKLYWQSKNYNQNSSTCKPRRI